MHLGMEEPIALRHTPEYLCWRLLAGFLAIDIVKAPYHLARRPSSSCAESNAGGVCGIGGLLHVAAGVEDIRARK